MEPAHCRLRSNGCGFWISWSRIAPFTTFRWGLRLGGALNVAVLQRCLNEILRRHEPLRTRFEAVEGQPVQVIQPVASLEMPLVDLRGLPEPEREVEARRLCMQEMSASFRSGTGPPAAGQVVSAGRDESHSLP